MKTRIYRHEKLRVFRRGMDALERLQAETAVELAALLPAILDRAFKGELRKQ